MWGVRILIKAAYVFFSTTLSHPARNTKDINPVNEEGTTYSELYI